MVLGDAADPNAGLTVSSVGNGAQKRVLLFAEKSRFGEKRLLWIAFFLEKGRVVEMSQSSLLC